MWRNDGGFATFEGKGVTYPTTDHGMTAIDGGGAFAYDANGNMTSRRTASGAATQTLTWSKDNLLQSVAIAGSATESYLYDNTGQRVKKSSGTLSTYYLFPELEIIRNGSTEIESKYYFFGGQRVATRNNDGSFVYLHSDHLGSVVAETLGTTAHPERYHAYGSTRSSTTLPFQDYKFTGQLSDGTGLVYMNARYYDPAIGQFISPDTIVPNPDNLQDYNRYMYARGNPLKYSDPSGHDPLDQAWQDEFYSVHGRTPNSVDMALRLFSIAYPDEWQEYLFYSVSGTSAPTELVNSVFHNTTQRDWAGFGNALESMAGWYKDDEIGLFVQDVAFLFAGMRGRYQPTNRSSFGPYWANGGYAGNIHIYLGQGNLPEGYFVRPGGDYDPDHNVHHWAAVFALSYNLGADTARLINELREGTQRVGGQVDLSDLVIGAAAASMGGSIRQNGSLSGMSNLLYSFLCWNP